MKDTDTADIVKSANEKFLAYETQLPDRIEAWCVANFNPQKEGQVQAIFEEILKAATSGEGNPYSLGVADMIIKKTHRTKSH